MFPAFGITTCTPRPMPSRIYRTFVRAACLTFAASSPSNGKATVLNFTFSHASIKSVISILAASSSLPPARFWPAVSPRLPLPVKVIYGLSNAISSSTVFSPSYCVTLLPSRWIITSYPPRGLASTVTVNAFPRLPPYLAIAVKVLVTASVAVSSSAACVVMVISACAFFPSVKM